MRITALSTSYAMIMLMIVCTNKASSATQDQKRKNECDAAYAQSELAGTLNGLSMEKFATSCLSNGTSKKVSVEQQEKGSIQDDPEESSHKYIIGLVDTPLPPEKWAVDSRGGSNLSPSIDQQFTSLGLDVFAKPLQSTVGSRGPDFQYFSKWVKDKKNIGLVGISSFDIYSDFWKEHDYPRYEPLVVFRQRKNIRYNYCLFNRDGQNIKSVSDAKGMHVIGLMGWSNMVKGWGADPVSTILQISQKYGVDLGRDMDVEYYHKFNNGNTPTDDSLMDWRNIDHTLQPMTLVFGEQNSLAMYPKEPGVRDKFKKAWHQLACAEDKEPYHESIFAVRADLPQNIKYKMQEAMLKTIDVLEHDDGQGKMTQDEYANSKAINDNDLDGVRDTGRYFEHKLLEAGGKSAINETRKRTFSIFYSNNE